MANIALNRPADASNYVYPYLPAKAVDGVVTPLTRWLGSSPLPPEPTIPAPVWLRIDLGQTFWVNRWIVKQMGTLGWSQNFNLTDYKLQGSLDYSNWFDMDTVTNNSANQTDRSFAGKKARWLRVYVTKGLRCNTNFASIADFEAYEAVNAPYLTGLTLSSGTLSPLFSSKVYSYSANVGTDVGTITVTPTAASGTIKVNDQVVASGTASNPITLNTGANTITVTVTSPDNTMADNYTIIVTKAGLSAYLSGLLLKTGGGGTIPLNPSFIKTNFIYDAGTTASTVKVTPTAEDVGATILVNNVAVPSGQPSGSISLNPGVNTISIQVNAPGGGQGLYTINVTKN